MLTMMRHYFELSLTFFPWIVVIACITKLVWFEKLGPLLSCRGRQWEDLTGDKPSRLPAQSAT